MCYDASLRKDGMIELIFTNFVIFFFYGREEGGGGGGGVDKEFVPGRINANLRSKIKDANSYN